MVLEPPLACKRHLDPRLISPFHIVLPEPHATLSDHFALSLSFRLFSHGTVPWSVSTEGSLPNYNISFLPKSWPTLSWLSHLLCFVRCMGVLRTLEGL